MPPRYGGRPVSHAPPGVRGSGGSPRVPPGPLPVRDDRPLARARVAGDGTEDTMLAFSLFLMFLGLACCGLSARCLRTDPPLLPGGED